MLVILIVRVYYKFSEYWAKGRWKRKRRT